jgi:hypothetical protein
MVDRSTSLIHPETWRTPMRSAISFRNLFVASALAAGLAFTSAASAGNCHAPRYAYTTVITWKIIQEPIYDTVTLYLPCGTPYVKTVLTYRSVKVPVETLVKVAY